MSAARVEDLGDKVVAADHARSRPAGPRRGRRSSTGRRPARPASRRRGGAAGRRRGGPSGGRRARPPERPELLQDAGPAGSEPGGELLGRGRAGAAQLHQDVAPERRRAGSGAVAAAGDDPESRADGGCGADGCLGIRPSHCRRLALGHAGRRAGATLGAWTSTSPPSTPCCARRSATSWSRRSRPVVDEHERERRFPVEVVRRLGEMGWLGIPIPEDEGGAGLDTLAYAIAIEEIGRVWGSLGLIVAAHTSLGCGPLHLAGTRRAEGALPRPDGLRPGPRRVRPDRARRRQRRGRHADDGGARGRAPTAAPG